MDTFNEEMQAYRKQLKLGPVKRAYTGLMKLMSNLRTRFQNTYPANNVSGSIFPGMMDMTFFTFSPEALQRRKLKIVVVFLHDTFHFESWLSGANKQVQAVYWKIFKESSWDMYPPVPGTKGTDAIIEHILVSEPDFSCLEDLTGRIEAETMNFCTEIESFLLSHDR